MLLQGDSYVDRSHAIVTPSRGLIHAEVYYNHLAMNPPPSGAKMIRLIVTGDEVGVAYNRAIRTILEYKERFRYIVTLEDDMIVPADGIEKLLHSIETHPEMAGISGLYYTKDDRHIPLVLGHPDVPQDVAVRNPTGFVECNVIPQGFGIFRADLYRELPFPWYITTRETQDVYFCRHARNKGYRFAVDCSIKAGHLDINTGKVY